MIPNRLNLIPKPHTNSNAFLRRSYNMEVRPKDTVYHSDIMT
jgi:hypothetical protein